MSALRSFPLTLREANGFIAEHHRHHQPVRFHLFSIGVMADEGLCGVIVVMRPVNQHRSFEGLMAEVSRLATDGTKNAASFLLGKAARIAFEMGFMGIQTYTLASEDGASLRAAGWTFDGHVPGKPWSRSSRPRNDSHPLTDKHRWVRIRSDIIRSARLAA